MNSISKNQTDLTQLSTKELFKIERDIAKRHMGHFPWLEVIWAFSNLAVWLALWPLVFTDIVPLWAAFIIASANAMLCYLPSHEAQHDIIARPGDRMRWLNMTVGHLSLIPIALPFRIARLTHLQHHKHANDPKLDPDYSTRAGGPWQAIWNGILLRQPRTPGGITEYIATLSRIGRDDVMLDGILYTVTFYGILCGLAWSGYALEGALLWWLPRHIGLTYIQFFLSWAPHHPATEKGRYRNARSFRSKLGNLGSMGMQYHIIHHLHPRIPLSRTPRAYWEMRDVLNARGCRIDDL